MSYWNQPHQKRIKEKNIMIFAFFISYERLWGALDTKDEY